MALCGQRQLLWDDGFLLFPSEYWWHSTLISQRPLKKAIHKGRPSITYICKRKLGNGCVGQDHLSVATSLKTFSYFMTTRVASFLDFPDALFGYNTDYYTIDFSFFFNAILPMLWRVALVLLLERRAKITLESLILRSFVTLWLA